MGDSGGNENTLPEAQSQKWQGYAAIAAVVITILSAAYNFSQNSNENTYTISDNSKAILGLQTDMQNQQVLIYSQAAQISALTQRVDDMQTKSGHQ